MIRRDLQIGLFIAALGAAGAAAQAQDSVKLAAPAPAEKAAKPAKGKLDKAAKVAPPEVPPGDAKPVYTEADLQRRAQALVTYKGGEVTVGELEDAVAQQSPFMRERYKDPKNLQELLDKTLRFELLSEAAGQRGADKDPAVRQAVKQNAVQAMMKSEFDDKMSASAVPAEEIANYYKTHIDEYVQPAMQRASMVKVATEAEAKTVLEQAKTMDLRAFRQLARDKSIDDATKLRGGDLRYFDAQGKVRGETEVTVAAPVVKASFALKDVGDTAPAPVKVDGGFAIVKLTGQRPAISRKPAEVEETIRVRLWREQRQKAIEGFVADLRERVKPELHGEMVELVKIDEAAPAKGAPEGAPGPLGAPGAPSEPAAPHDPHMQ